MLDAVVGGEASDAEVLDLSRFQVCTQGPAFGCTAFERRVARTVRIFSFRDDDRRRRKLQVGMKPRALTVLDTVHGPFAAVRLEMAGDRGMPVARGIDRYTSRDCIFDVPVEDRDDAIALRNRKRASGTKVVLHIDDQQRLAYSIHQSSCLMRSRSSSSASCVLRSTR